MPSGQRQTILVTGGAGFIGSHVCDALLAEGHAVRCMDDLATGNLRNIQHLDDVADFTFIQGDIRSMEDVAVALKGSHAVVHLAALGSVPRSIAYPLDSEAVNLGGFLNVIEAMRIMGLKRIVYASSSSVYGDSPELPKVEGREGEALSPYAVTKRMNETYARLYHRLYGLEAIGLRFFNIFGERQDPEGAYAAAIPKFIRALLRHEAPVVHGDGLQTRDFTYVGNAVQAILQTLWAPADRSGQVFNIAYGDSCDLLSLLGKLRDRLVLIDPAAADVGVEHVPARAGDVRASLADISKARRDLGYSPRYSLDEGLDRAVPWYAAHWR